MRAVAVTKATIETELPDTSQHFMPAIRSFGRIIFSPTACIDHFFQYYLSLTIIVGSIYKRVLTFSKSSFYDEGILADIETVSLNANHLQGEVHL